jgi:hypothetical protein
MVKAMGWLLCISYLRQYRTPTRMIITATPPTAPMITYFVWLLEDFEAPVLKKHEKF